MRPPSPPSDARWFAADWPAPARVHTLITTREGGVSLPPYASLNLASHVGDQAEHVAQNRAQLQHVLPNEPYWLNQVHGTQVVQATSAARHAPSADASVSTQAHVVCAILTADCLPVLLTDRSGQCVGACHAGWRGLAHGIIEATVRALAAPPGELLAWLGPAIGPSAFEVGEEVRAAFVTPHPHSATAFTHCGTGKYLADLTALARLRLSALGVTAIYGGQYCTVRENARFFSYRREGKTGRFASLIWLADTPPP